MPRRRLLLGLALWTSPVALALALPALLWTCLRVRSARAVASGLAGAAVGALPWLLETAKSHFKTLQTLPGQPESPFARYLHVYTQVIPGAGGLGESAAARAIGLVALATVLLGTAAALWRRNPTMLALGASTLIASAVITASHVAVDPTAARYATYLIPTLSAVVAWALCRVRLAGVALVVLLGSWTIGTVWNSTNGLAAVPDPAVGTPITALAAYLEQHGRTDVWADYWIAYMLSAATQERVDRGRSLTAPGGELPHPCSGRAEDDRRPVPRPGERAGAACGRRPAAAQADARRALCGLDVRHTDRRRPLSAGGVLS